MFAASPRSLAGVVTMASRALGLCGGFDGHDLQTQRIFGDTTEALTACPRKSMAMGLDILARAG
jgi:hypothetical protein